MNSIFMIQINGLIYFEVLTHMLLIFVFMVLWFYGFMVLWFYGFMFLCLYAFIYLWSYDFMVLCKLIEFCLHYHFFNSLQRQTC